MRILDDFIKKDIEAFYSSNLDKSVYRFMDIVYEYITEKDLKCLLFSTELRFLIDEVFGPSYNLGNFSSIDNSLVTLKTALDESVILKDIFFFYGGIYSNLGNRKLFEKLKTTWENHRNIIYQLSAILILHLIGMFIIKENLC